MKSIMALVLFSLLFSLGITSHAQTPDGETPAVEEVCDVEVGAAYGLCTAYCEAMDCDSYEPKASEKACARVKANYEKKTGEVPPCDPCFDVMCEETTMCVEGQCICASNNDCALLEDCNDDGVCEDPCVDLAAEAECPCEYLSLIPQTEECWGFENGPEFNTSSDFCFTQNSFITMDRMPSEMTTYVGNGMRTFGDLFDCTMRIVGNPSCSADALDMTIGFNSTTQYNTCNCRVEQYTNRLEENVDIANGDPPFSCSPCGNGALDQGEACDDGNTLSGDGCSADCSTVEDGFVCPVPGEPCTSSVCGDGILDPEEACDDGNQTPLDGCNGDCSSIEPNFECPVPGQPCTEVPPDIL